VNLRPSLNGLYNKGEGVMRAPLQIK